MKIKIDEQHGIQIISLKGESYVSTAGELRKAIERGMDLEDEPRIVLDLCEVEYFTSDEIGVIVELQKRTMDRGGKLRVCHVGHSLLELLRILRLDTILSIDESIEESFAALGFSAG